MTAPKRFSINRRLRSFVYAIRGIKVLLQSQHNAWIHAIATILVCIAGFAFHLSSIEWCMIVIAIMAVWTSEALNTSLELLTDLASPEIHPLAAKAKDVAAGAVLLASIGAAILGVIILLPHAWTMATR